MSEIVGFVGLSHSPFINFMPPDGPDAPGGRFLAAAAVLSRAVETARPDVLVVIGPDHFHANFYDVMPPFLIGAGAAEGFGDYGSRSGPFDIATDMAWSVFEDVSAAGFDPALSLDLVADHGIVQAIELVGPQVPIPIVPVIVNCAGPPLPSLHRCRDFGGALGKALRSADGGARVLIVSSGGLSHWIPSTEPRVKALGGTTTARVNGAFDRWFLEQVRDGRLDRLAALQPDEVVERAGNGGQEVRTWLVGLAAAEATVAWTDYEPVPQWLTGMGAATSLPVGT
jgi:2,3-dihydroxyphenylpropionate 1,2-dioxygenase